MRQVSEFEKSQQAEQCSDDAVCIVGAGFSGLAVARALRQRNVPFRCIDRAAALGGVWRYPDADQPLPGPAYRSLHLNTSRHVTEFTGFPMPSTYPRYPRHDQVMDYLDQFVEHYDLRRDMEFNTEITAVRRRRDSTWEVTSHDHGSGAIRHRRFRQVVVASGHHWEPKLPDPPIRGSQTFPGECLHTRDYSGPSAFAGKRVVVVGLGNSACDIAVELSHVADTTILATRRGAHVVPKQMMGIPIDEISASRWWAWLPFRLQRRFIEVLLRIIRGHITSYGLPEPDHRIFSAPITISDELLSRLAHGAVTPKPMIDHFDSSTVYFADGTSADVDAIIYCTGYHVTVPFVPRNAVFSDSGQVGLYQRVVAPFHPGLYFVGLVRPVGALTRLVEYQAEWVADLVEGVVVPPSTREMVAEIHRYLHGVTERYSTAVGDSIHVDVPVHLQAIRRERKAGRRRARGTPATIPGGGPRAQSAGATIAAAAYEPRPD